METYYRKFKQHRGVEWSQHRSAEAQHNHIQHNHIQVSIRAFLRLDLYRVKAEISFYELKTAIIPEAIRAYLADPTYASLSGAQALI